MPNCATQGPCKPSPAWIDRGSKMNNMEKVSKINWESHETSVIGIEPQTCGLKDQCSPLRLYYFAHIATLDVIAWPVLAQ